MAQVTCPSCGSKFTPKSPNLMPFCSRRCQQVDLNRWLTEEHRLPIEDQEITDTDALIEPLEDEDD